MSMSAHHDRSIAISNALGLFLNAQQTIDAMLLWQEKYACEPRLSVQYFARECCQLFCQEAERHQLVKNLVRELYTQLHALDHIQLNKTE